MIIKASENNRIQHDHLNRKNKVYDSSKGATGMQNRDRWMIQQQLEFKYLEINASRTTG
jgi:hypothetical protein